MFRPIGNRDINLATALSQYSRLFLQILRNQGTQKGGWNDINMESDNLYMIPFLSKELNLLGYSQLPFTKHKVNSDSGTDSSSKKGSSDLSGSETDMKSLENAKISFNSKEMIRTLVGVCVQLVNDMKLSCQTDKHSDEYDRILFENRNLQKHVEAHKKALEKKERIITEGDEKCRQLKVKLNELEEKVKSLEKEKLKNIKQQQLNEDIMKHQKKKTERDLFQLHKVLYHEKNMVDMKYLPQNFDVVQEKQPDFKKLWSQVKYSSVAKKEEALKKAVCIFQENNELLMEDNSLLKTLLFLTFEEIHALINDICNKLNLPIRKTDEGQLQNIFMAGKGLQVQLYKEWLRKELDIVTNLFNYIDEFSFCVDGNLFLPLTDVVNKLISNLK